jgi:hypothetical protein
MSLLLGLALASDRGPGTWEIGASPAGQGEGHAALAVTQIGLPGQRGSMTLPGGELFYALTDSVAVQARTQVGPVFADGRTYPLAFGYVGARWLVVDNPAIKVAPTLGTLALQRPDDGLIGGAAVGVALDAGGERVRFDMSWPLVGFAFQGAFPLFVPPWAGLLATEVGVTIALGDHALRVGTTAWFPMATFRYRPDGRVFVDVSVGAGVEFGPTAGTVVGVRF